MRREIRRLMEAGAERAARVREAVLEGWDPFGDPRMCVSVREVVTAAVVLMKEPWSRGLEREIQQAFSALGARLYSVGGRRLLLGVRRRGQSIAEALEHSKELRKWATGGRGRSRRSRDVQQEAPSGPADT